MKIQAQPLDIRGQDLYSRWSHIPIMDSQQTLLYFSKPFGPDLTSERNVESPLAQGAKKFCKCGCGRKLTFNKYHPTQRYAHGHNRKGYTKMFLTKEELEDLYINQNLSAVSIGKKVGLRHDFISKWLKKYEISRESNRPSKEELARLYLNKRLNTVEIAKKLNVNQPTVYNWIRDYDIPIRTMSEARKKIRPENYLIECACGCKGNIWRYTSRWKQRRFKVGHHNVVNSEYTITNYRRIPKLILQERLEELYITQKLSVSSIAKQVNLHIGTIYKYIKDYNIRLRTIQETWNLIKPRPKNRLVYCKCGCGRQRWLYDKKLRKREYIYAHMPEDINKGNTAWNKGKTFEELYGETKAKIKRQERRYHRSKQIFPITDTSIEIKIQNYLKQLGISFFTHQYMNQIKHAYQCDIWVPVMNLIIECDGDYWHANPDRFKDEDLDERQRLQKEKDIIITKELIEKGFKILRLWEKEINSMGLGEFKERLSNS